MASQESLEKIVDSMNGILKDVGFEIYPMKVSTRFFFLKSKRKVPLTILIVFLFLIWILLDKTKNEVTIKLYKTPYRKMHNIGDTTKTIVFF